jgi:hypothetical protein
MPNRLADKNSTTSLERKLLMPPFHGTTDMVKPAIHLTILAALVFTVAYLNESRASANDGGGHVGACSQCGKACGHGQLVTCTVMVPCNVLETRVKTSVVKELKQQTEKYTVFQLKPVSRKIEKECWYLKDVIKTETVTDEQCHLVKVPVIQNYEVKCYHPECREVVPADGCGNCPPQVCEVMVETREPASRTCEEVKVAIAKTTKDIHYCAKEPTPRKVPCMTEETFDLVAVEKERTVDVCIPRIVRTPVDVMVCKEIPQTIVCCAECAKKHRHR